MRSTKIWTLAFAVCCITASNTTMATTSLPAHQCGSLYEAQNYPPGQAEAGDYYHIAPNLIEDATVEKLRDFADQLDGDRWHGTALHTRCISAPDDTRTTITSFDVDAEFNKRFNGALIMELQQENAEDVVINQINLSPDTELDESLDYTLDADYPSKTHGQRTGSRNFRVDFLSPNTLVYNQKYRRIVCSNAVNIRLDGLGLQRRCPERVGLPQLGLVAQQRVNGDRISENTIRVVHEVKTISFNNTGLTVSRDVYVDRKFVSQQQWQFVRS